MICDAQPFGTWSRCGLSRSVAVQLTGHKTGSVYQRHAITSEADLREGVERLNGAAKSQARSDGKLPRSSTS